MALIKSVKDLTPKWGKDCYFSENATIVGEVTMGDECSIWFNAVLRGDVAPITLGNRVNVQDGSCDRRARDMGRSARQVHKEDQASSGGRLCEALCGVFEVVSLSLLPHDSGCDFL